MPETLSGQLQGVMPENMSSSYGQVVVRSVRK